MAAENVYLASKPRYEILDGLRGVAAMMVVLFHLFETYSKGPAFQIINHGYLAVDFFFVLSGFVIGYAYDDRWGRMSARGFFKRRLTRLHPMVIIGTIIGAALFFFQIGPGFPGVAKAELWKFLLCIVLGCLMIPVSPGMDIRGWQESYPLNGPQWSLFLEYCANILYVLIFRRLPKVALAVLCVVCAFFTLDLTMGWDVFGIFPVHEFTTPDGNVLHFGGPQFNVIGGWSITGQQLYIGFSRLMYPFLCGLLISRIIPSGSPIRLKGGFWWCALALVVIMAMPCIGGKQGIADGIFQAVSILLMFPLIVLAGAGSMTTHVFSTKVCRFLGAISYPLYITHYPLIYMQITWASTHQDAPLWQHIALAAGIFILAVGMAYALLKAFDEPVREWLKDHWLKRQKQAI